MFIEKGYYTNRVDNNNDEHKSLRADEIVNWHACRATITRKIEAGRRVRELRERQKLSQRELATYIPGLSGSRLGNYEQGTRTIDTDIAVALARHFNVSVSFILAIDDESTLEPREKALLEAYRSTDSRGKDTISRIADSQPASEELGDRLGKSA